MQQVIHGANTSHPSFATLLTNLARSYQKFGQLQKAAVIHEQGLDMKRAIYIIDAAHPEIVYSLRDLSNIHALHPRPHIGDSAT